MRTSYSSFWTEASDYFGWDVAEIEHRLTTNCRAVAGGRPAAIRRLGFTEEDLPPGLEGVLDRIRGASGTYSLRDLTRTQIRWLVEPAPEELRDELSRRLKDSDRRRYIPRSAGRRRRRTAS